MDGLVGYGSSDNEEDGGYSRTAEPHSAATSTPSRGGNGINPQTSGSRDFAPATAHDLIAANHGSEACTTKADALHPLIGPQAPPAHGVEGVQSDGYTSQLSPYSENRATIRNLTLPTGVNLDIPPSPPGSPSAGMSQKFERFAQLKNQGMHFNGKLAGSSALKNPMLLQKLMSSAGLTVADQYATTLSKDLWDPTALPAWANKEALAKSQQDFSSRRDDEKLRAQREGVEFVSAMEK
ncbi:MAG: hypothetical protein Q9169_002953 [Polycauliona sp. 2 TL-2023]